jgi:tRNA uracil 4-sulfurtransferase
VEPLEDEADLVQADGCALVLREAAQRTAEELDLAGGGIVDTGDNVGQVASQTLHSLHTINEVTTFPILRPLVTMDKLEIIEIAKEIGTYDTSILPYEDCCTIFQPKSPKTMPTRKAADKVEQSLAVEELVCHAVDKTESTIYEGIGERDEQQNMDNLF